ncbi:conjugal transfer protein [Neomoorella thermoacetica]|uniref:conjugal transfer protein n=1 Tax=Neomoorella thermoacetica TaxID=1525 RepID=UPI0030CB8B89
MSPFLFRRIAAGIVWCLLILSLLFSVRASVFAARAYNTLAVKAYTPDEASLRESVAETARQFAVEWATWLGDPDEYAKRLSAFLSDPSAAPLPRGVQRAVAASAVSTRQDGPDVWRVDVVVHVERLVKLPQTNAYSVPPALRAADTSASEPQPQAAQGQPQQQAEVSVWRAAVIQVEIPVRTAGGKAAVAGLPAIIPVSRGQGKAAAPTGFGDSPPDNLAAFVNQFLDLYYSGGNVQNFVADGSGVSPLGGWKLQNVDQVQVDNKNNPTKALVECEVTAPGTQAVKQRIVLDLTVFGGRFLVKGLKAAMELGQ